MGAPYIYDISRLRVKGTKLLPALQITSSLSFPGHLEKVESLPQLSQIQPWNLFEIFTVKEETSRKYLSLIKRKPQ